MLFTIQAEKQGENKRVFTYDNQANILMRDDGLVFEYPNQEQHQYEQYTAFDKDHPLKKSDKINHLKIQMGLSCNYSCDYCSQKFVERSETTTAHDIAPFMEKLKVLQFSEEAGLTVEFWGGEPLVYWKTLKPLAEAIKEKFSSWEKPPRFSIITNGSILTDEIIDWLMMLDFNVSISHDGPGQSVRGPDPFDDPEKRDRILGFYRMMTRLKKGISFNSMLSAKNKSRYQISEWFRNLTGDKNVMLGEGGIVDAYDEDGITNSLITKQDHFEFRRLAFADIYGTDGDIGFKQQLSKIDSFTNSVLAHIPASTLGQKCGMDSSHVLAVDLLGNVLTCQNVSAAEISKNGESHLAGNLDDYNNVSITTSTHWSKRDKCSSCPVLHLCKGACMFLDNKFWDISCSNAYSDNVALFALAFQKITGYIPTLIEADGLPDDRKDIFGTILEHKENPQRKVIPIKIVSEVVNTIDDIEVYGQARIEL